MEEIRLMKGNEVVAEAAVRCGCDGYFGYPITPQSEILETLTAMRPWETTGMVVLQAESEVAAVNMLYGGAACGRRVMASSSSPGISLMCEGLSYLAGAELPCVVVNVSILSDGVIGQMMEKVMLTEPRPRWSDAYIAEHWGGWATTGKPADRKRNIVTSVELDPLRQERFNLKLSEKYRTIRENEVRYEAVQCDDADYVLVAYGSSARISQKTVELAREEGLKVGLLRPVTLYPFPTGAIDELSQRVKGFLSVEMSTGQMIEDVQLAARCRVPVFHFGRTGGVVHSPSEVLEALKKNFSLK